MRPMKPPLTLQKPLCKVDETTAETAADIDEATADVETTAETLKPPFN